MIGSMTLAMRPQPLSIAPLVRGAAGLLSDRSEPSSPPRLVAAEMRPKPQNPRAGTVARVPFYHRSGTVALLDDDPDFVEMLASALPKGWRVRTFLSPSSCLDYLQQQPPQWEADFWTQQELIAEWRTGVPIIPLVLRYWASNPSRTELTKVLVLDYMMPARDGLDTLRDLADWPGHRVLMTGVFDDRLAIDAFNAGLIDHFIVKQHASLRGALVEMVEGLLARPNARYHQIWSSALTPPQMLLLQRLDVAEELLAFLRASFTEWVLVGEPFGVLGLDSRGAAHWVQLEPGRHLGDLADVAREAGMADEDVAEIRAGRKLTNLEVRRTLGMRGGDMLPARQVGDEAGVLYAAVTRIELRGSPEASSVSGHQAGPPKNENTY